MRRAVVLTAVTVAILASFVVAVVSVRDDRRGIDAAVARSFVAEIRQERPRSSAVACDKHAMNVYRCTYTLTSRRGGHRRVEHLALVLDGENCWQAARQAYGSPVYFRGCLTT